MNILFIYYDINDSPLGKYHEGIALLSTVIKQAGHEVSLMHITENAQSSELLDCYKKEYSDSDIVACSVNQMTLAFYQDFFHELKKEYNVYTVCGGPVATLCPDNVIAGGSFDALCRGDGEQSLLELVQMLSSGGNHTEIEGFWFYNEGNIIKNPVRAIVSDNTACPIPDRTIFDISRLVNYRQNTMPVMATRGCPFNCSFCSNHALKNVFPNRKDYIRYKKVDRLIDEIKAEIVRCKMLGVEISNINFYDDLLIINKKWFIEFSEAYIREIGLPYSCNCRFELLDEEVLARLKLSGCHRIQMGIETGDEELRRDVLNRRQSDAMIETKAKLCHKYGISIHTFTMIGIPQEKLANTLQTVKLSAKVGAESVQVAIFYPFLATKLYDVCKENNYLQDKQVASYLEGESALNLPTISAKQIQQASNNFHPFYQLYRRLYALPVWLRFIPEKTLDVLWFNYWPAWPVRLLYRIARRCK